MNWDAYHERQNNKRHVVAHLRQGHKVLEVDRCNITFKGRPWLELSDYDKRKFETNLFLEHMNNERILVKVLYV